ncbi:MAG: tetratricopeptide repeat protein [Acidimicrobiia bacterium]
MARGRRGRAAAPVDEEADEGRLADDPSIARAVGRDRVERFEERLRDAGRTFRRGRYDDARRILRALAEQAPTAESVRELLGLTYYRLGRWRDARRELAAFHDLSGSVEQHPVLADVHRALGQHSRVDELWAELRDVSPSAELVAEGRIVAAGSLADRGRLSDAIALLERARPPAKRPKEHHLRTTYALADLYERAGDLPRARALFATVARHDPELGDVARRIAALS